MQQMPSRPPPAPRLGAGARLGAAAVVLVGSLVGSVLAFYGVGYGVDALMDAGVVRCGDEVGCGIGAGFLMVLVGAAGCVLGSVTALVLALAAPGRWGTGRALAAAGWVTGGLVLLVALAMVGVLVAGAGDVTPG
jgi:hypothetical protein